MYVKIEEVRIDNIPPDIENFRKAAADMMMDPVKTAALFIFSLNIYSQNREKGIPLLDFLLADGVKIQSFDTVEKNPLIARSYLKGATPENGYTPHIPETVLIRNDGERGIKRYLKTVYVGCGGTDSYRPLTLIRIKRRKLPFKSRYDLWFVHEYPSIILDVKPCKL